MRWMNTLAVALTCTSAAAALDDGLVRYYAMESVQTNATGRFVLDATGSGKDLKLSENASLVDGASGRALNVTGDVASFAAFPCPGLKSRTVTFWVKRSAAAGSAYAQLTKAEKYPHVFANLSQMRLTTQVNVNAEGKVSLPPTATLLIRDNPAGLCNGSYMRVGKWLHIAIVVDVRSTEKEASNLRTHAYIDGKLVAPADTESCVTRLNIDIPGTAVIGNSNTDGKQGVPFAGAIDEFRVYSRALTPEEVLADYQRISVVGK